MSESFLIPIRAIRIHVAETNGEIQLIFPAPVEQMRRSLSPEESKQVYDMCLEIVRKISGHINLDMEHFLQDLE